MIQKLTDFCIYASTPIIVALNNMNYMALRAMGNRLVKQQTSYEASLQERLGSKWPMPQNSK
jgi:hypothetical protein